MNLGEVEEEIIVVIKSSLVMMNHKALATQFGREDNISSLFVAH